MYKENENIPSKRFRLVSEQKKTEERDFLFWPREKWNDSQKMKEGGGGGEGRKRLQTNPSILKNLRSPANAAPDWLIPWSNIDMTGQVGRFQNRGVCPQAFPSFLPHPLPALLLTPFLPRSLTFLVLCS